jgi:hypothetical protein
MSVDLEFFDRAVSGRSRRSQLLLAAAEAADNLQNFAGTGESGAPDRGATVLRELVNDEIVFASQPEVYPIKVEEAMKSARLPSSVESADFGAPYKYFLVRFPFDVQPAGPWNFNELKVRIEFSAGPNERRPKVQGLFPEARFQDVLKADASLEIGLTPSAEFAVNTGALSFDAAPMSASAQAEVSARAKAGAGLAVGPFQLAWRKAIVKTSQPGLEWVWWQVGGADLKRGDTSPFMVVLQVANEATSVIATGQVQASRYYNLIRNAFQNITNWPKVYREFVEAGAPYLAGPTRWDLSKDVTRAN